MSLFDNIGDIEAGGDYKMPVGSHPALITNVFIDEEKETVAFKVNFNGTSVVGNGKFWLGGDDPDKVKKGLQRVAKQLKNLFGRPITNGKEMQKAIREMDGKYAMIEVAPNKRNPDFQLYWIEGPYVPARGADATAAVTGSDDLPF